MLKRILIRALFLLLFTVVSLLSVFFYFQSHNIVYPGEVTFFEGASVREVADTLEVNGNIKSANVFYYYIKAKEAAYDLNPFTDKIFEPSFKSGTYSLDISDYDDLIEYI